ncbi:hypothetical protein ONZ45_g141 [Pleurotus djamor]|nr:hypothetical protein ONZ45_g141 [Pleurotus djamor]
MQPTMPSTELESPLPELLKWNESPPGALFFMTFRRMIPHGADEERLQVVFDVYATPEVSKAVSGEFNEKVLAPMSTLKKLNKDYPASSPESYYNLLIKNVSRTDRRSEEYSRAFNEAFCFGWNKDFQGTADEALWDYIVYYYQLKLTSNLTCANYLTISQSTATMCLLPPGAAGYPPCDTLVREYMLTYTDPESKSYIRIVAFLIALLERITRLIREDERYVHTNSYTEAANLFREDMKGDMTSVHGKFRQEFYASVVRSATAKLQETQGEQLTPSNLLSSLRKACIEAVDALRQKPDAPSMEPAILLSFDEAHELTERTNLSSSPYVLIRRALQNCIPCAIYTVFLSTHRNSTLSANPSSRVLIEEFVEPVSYSDLGFDHLAIPTKLGSGDMKLGLKYVEEEVDNLSLDFLTSTWWMTRLGRPIFGAVYDSEITKVKNMLVKFVAQKLLNVPTITSVDSLDELNEHQILACLGSRLPIEFVTASGDSGDGAELTQIGEHLRICLRPEDSRNSETMVSVASSEPIVSEAAALIMHTKSPSPIEGLRRVMRTFPVEKGDRGEYIMLLLAILARDKVFFDMKERKANKLQNDDQVDSGRTKIRAHRSGGVYQSDDRRVILVKDFINALITIPGKGKEKNLDGESMAEGVKYGVEDEDQESYEALRQLAEDFPNASMHFNHFIRPHDRGGYSPPVDAPEIDAVIPALLDNIKVHLEDLMLVLFCVKNNLQYTDRPDNALFDEMDPYDIGVLHQWDPAVPLICIVMALASPKPGVSIVRVEKSDAYPAVRYHIWVAGVSDAYYGPIKKDEQSIWKAAVDTSRDRLRPWQLKISAIGHRSVRRARRRRRVRCQ